VGRVVWWSVPDRDADAAAGQRTTSVRRGAVGALHVARLLLSLGLAVLVWGLWWSAGALAAAVGAAGHAVFTASTVTLSRRVAAGASVSSHRLRVTAMPMVLVADLAIVGIALVR